MIGDVIASRHSQDRENLQQTLARVMGTVNKTIPAIQPIMMTVGDEFQGLHAGLADSFRAALRLRLALLPAIDVRIGIGWGELTLEPTNPPFGQDGPCWWRARDAIEEVKRGETSKSVPKSRRVASYTGTDLDQLLNGYLGARDHILSGFDEIDLGIAALKLEGVTQAAISKTVGLSQSSVSRRLHSHGIFVVLDEEPRVIEVES